MLNKAYRKLIGIIPNDVDMRVLMDTVVTKPLQKLEKGIVIERAGGQEQSVKVCGSLFAMLGDSPGLASVMRLKGVTAKCPSRYSYSLKKDLNSSYGRMAKLRQGKDYQLYEKLWSTIDNRTYGQVGRARKLLLRLGLKSKKSSLWELRWFRRNPWKRLGICYLHESLWGNWKRHLVYLGAKYGDEFRLKVNKRATHMERWYPTMKKNITNIYRLNYDKKTKKKYFGTRFFHCGTYELFFASFGILFGRSDQ